MCAIIYVCIILVQITNGKGSRLLSLLPNVILFVLFLVQCLSQTNH